tara:strand:- start:1473 stop:3311 length:1839 start_codon:yes stop_codon:yes gene_type:complete
MSAPKVNKPISYINETLSMFKEKAAGTNLAEISHWFSEPSYIERYHHCIKKEQQVFTLLFTDAAKKINTFFYPMKVRVDDKAGANDTDTSLSELIHINGSNGILINGRLGQGKSMLLKYLQYLELNTGRTVPIFLELRKIKNSSQFIEICRNKFNELGLPCSEKLFEFLLSEGRISLFFDGFDELPFEAREEFNSALSSLVSKYSKAKIIVTSRENTEISINTSFKKYKIAELTETDLAPFIKQILRKSDLYQPIIAKIKESDEFDFSVLNTPLMVTWFIIVYNKRFKIPKTKLGFYEDLFGAILSRHDGIKESYNRASKSRLNDEELKHVFSALCYITRKDQNSIFTKTEINSYIKRALNITDFESVKPSDYLYDLTHVTCLMKLDGHDDYEFIHNSVAQYFSALFIKNTDDDNGKVFYTSKLKDSQRFEDELNFLETIDHFRYIKYFILPLREQLVDHDAESLNNDIVRSLLDSSRVAIFSKSIESKEEPVDLVTVIARKSAEFKYKYFFRSENDWETTFESGCTDILYSISSNDADKFREAVVNCLPSDKTIFREVFTYVDFKELLDQYDLFEQFVKALSFRLYEPTVKASNKYVDIIAAQKKKKGLFE